ncbi:MAG: arginine--tRNA ligase [Nitrospirales bacterium]
MSLGIVRDKVMEALTSALEAAKGKGLLKSDTGAVLTVDLPKRPEWGDLASPVAMSVAAAEGRSPYDVAQIILDNLPQRDAIFARVEIAKPGFLNMTVKRELWLQVPGEIEAQESRYGQADLGGGRRVLIEFVSANPTGPLHVGHGRGAAVGHAIANLLAATGHDVVREYYVNDAGRQMKLLGASVYARYQELQGRTVSFPEDGYRGSYIESVAASIKEQEGSRLLEIPREQAELRCQTLGYRMLLERIREDLEAFGMRFDAWFSEASLVASGAVESVLNDLRKRDLLFEEEGALWFRSSAYGDEKDRVVRKREGEYTYLASDIAYHRDKLQRGYELLIDVWGADHHGYIPRMQAVMEAYGHPKTRLQVVLVQMVNLLRGGAKVEMSKRAGEFITLREVMDEVGADAAKFFFLMRRSDTPLDFDLELAKAQSAENPVYYVQYAHARIASLFRVAGERGYPVPTASAASLDLLTDLEELNLIRKLSAYPSIVQGSASALEPHRLTYYLQELAGQLHTFYFRHRILPPAVESDERDSPGFGPESDTPSPRAREVVTPELTSARLCLVRQVQRVLRNGLELLGVTAPERM